MPRMVAVLTALAITCTASVFICPTSVLASDPSPEGVLTTYERPCANGEGEACVRLGERYLAEVGADAPASVAAAKKACAAGEPKDCLFGVAYVLQHGHGVPVNKAHALSIFETACRYTNGEACYAVGVARLAGDGGPVDKKAAMQAFSAACSADNGDGCVELARCYRTGVGVTEERGSANGYSFKACKLGAAEGCADLAEAAARGERMPIDAPPIDELRKRACAAGADALCRRAEAAANTAADQKEHAKVDPLENACAAAKPRGAPADDELLWQLFGPPAYEIPGRLCVADGLKAGLPNRGGVTPLLERVRQTQTILGRSGDDARKAYLTLARTDVGLAPYQQGLDEELAPLAVDATRFRGAYSVTFQEYNVPPPTGDDTLRVVAAFGAVDDRRDEVMLGLAAEAHRSARICRSPRGACFA